MEMALENKIKKVIELRSELSNSIHEIQDKFDEICSGCLQFEMDMGTALVKDKYKDKSYFLYKEVGFFEDESEVIRTWVPALAEIMCEQDYPVSLDQGKKFCKFFELDENETKIILDKCATQDQYEEYVNYERRNMEY